jgi:anti-anti-sigma regulatory factor
MQLLRRELARRPAIIYTLASDLFEGLTGDMDKTIDLTVSIEEWGLWRIVRFSGNFIVNSIPLVRKRLDELEAGNQEKVALDLSMVTGFDAAAMSIILNFHHMIIRANGCVAVIAPGENIRESFAKIGFESAVPIFDSFDLFMRSNSVL